MDLNTFKNRATKKEHILTVGSYTFTKANLIGGVDFEHTANSGVDLVLGSCTSAKIEFTLNNMNNLINNLVGQEIVWNVRVNDTENVPMGVFIAEQPTKINDTTMRVVAYDRMTKFDIVVDEWLRSVSYPITLKNYLISLCNYVGVPLVESSFINETYPVKFNYMGENVTGRDVLKWITEIIAKFAIINELGQLKLGWYNSIVYGVNNSNYYGVEIEDYTVKKIDKLQVQSVENDIGVVVGIGTNAYVIQGNPLLYAETDAEIRPYIETLFNAIKDFAYVPYNLTVNFNPLIKVGNTFNVTTRKGDTFNALVMNRKVKGWTETYSATGNANRVPNNALNRVIHQLRGKSNVLERTIEQTISRLYDADSGDLTQLTQTVNSFSSRVQTIESNMNFKYQQDTPPVDPEVGDVWFNTNPNGFIVDLLLMTVNEMIHPVDYYSATLNKSYRWTGTTWEHVEDGAITELRVNVSEINQTVDSIGLTVQAYDGRIGGLEVTANSITSRVSTAESNISEIIQTADTITSKILNIEGDISSIEQTASSIQSSVSNINGEISTIKQTATGIQTQVTNNKNSISTVTQTASSIQSQVTNLKNNTESSITQLSNSISLKVTSGDVKNMLNINTSGVQINANNIDLTGITRISSPSYPSQDYFTFYGNGVALYESGIRRLQIYYDGFSTIFSDAPRIDFNVPVSFNSGVDGLDVIVPYYNSNWCYLDYISSTGKIEVRNRQGTFIGELTPN